MTSFLPVDYAWWGPFVRTDTENEPDNANADALVIYDYSLGRVGSQITIHVGGSDDNTKHSMDVETSVIVHIPETPGSANAVGVAVTYECQEVKSEIQSSNEEYGTSEIGFEWSSIPFVTVLGAGGPTTSHGDPLFKAVGQGSDGPVTDGYIVLDDAYRHPPPPKSEEQRTFELLNLPIAGSIQVQVGIVDRLAANSNDWTYTALFRNHWIITQIDVQVI